MSDFTSYQNLYIIKNQITFMKLCPYVSDRYCTTECMAYILDKHGLVICDRAQREYDMIEALENICSAIIGK